MKKRTYGSALETEDLSASGSEFYKPTDILSYSTLNRAIESIFEDNENSYEVLQDVVKSLWGQKETGILPDIYEEMDIGDDSYKKLVCDSMPTGKYYIRVPLGAFIAKIPDKYYNYYKYLSEENAQYDRNFFADYDHNSIIVFNRPNINLFERQMAEHLNINLNDEDNKIEVNYELKNDRAATEIEGTDEQTILDYNNNRKSITRSISYSAKISTTRYEYKTIESGGTAIETYVNEVPYNDLGKNIFEVTKKLSSGLGNYLMKEDDNYSLEEIVPLSTTVTNSNGNSVSQTAEANTSDDVYYLFYNLSSDIGGSIEINGVTYNCENGTIINNNEGNVKVIAYYSYSKKFAIAKENYFKTYFAKSGIPLYSFKLSYTGQENATPVPIISSEEAKLQKIDRTKLDIRNLNVANLINNLVLEKQGTSYNISNSHYWLEDKDFDNHNGNINIGDFTLGYRQVNGEDKNPSLWSQYYRDLVGNYNIAIGDKAMRNSNEPTNNIAIGRNALININDGIENIEIGNGSEVDFTKHNYNINIGDNLSKVVETENYKATINNNNTILGYGNLLNTKITDKNTVVGQDNIFSELNTGNYVIGEKNGCTKDSSGKINNSAIVEANNYIIGYKNLSDNVADYISDLVKENYIFGQSNKAKASNSTIIGYSNTNNGDKSFLIGKENENDSTDSYIFGVSNSNSENAKSNIVIGNENNSKNINNNIFGNKNSSSGANNYVFGLSNIIDEDSNQNILIGKNNKSSDNYNILIGTWNGNITHVFEKDDNEASTNFVLGIGNNLAVKATKNNIVLGKNNKIGKENSIVIGNSFEEKEGNVLILKPNSLISSIKDDYETTQDEFTDINRDFFLKLYDINNTDTNNGKDYNAIINGYTIKVNAFDVFFLRNLIVNHELTSNYNIAANINREYSTHYLAEDNKSLLSMPVAGTLLKTSWDGANQLSEIKSFIGVIKDNEADENKKYYISIRPNNGVNNGEYVAFEIDHELYNSIAVKNEKNVSTILIDDSTAEQTKKGNLTIDGIFTVNNTVAIEKIFGENNIGYFKVFDEDENIKTNKDIYARSFIATSARSKKKNIVETTHHAIDEINKIKIVDFNFKTDINNENPKVGFIADDTDAIFSTKDHNSMDIYNCVGMLLKAVQELSAENEELKKKLS